MMVLLLMPAVFAPLTVSETAVAPAFAHAQTQAETTDQDASIIEKALNYFGGGLYELITGALKTIVILLSGMFGNIMLVIAEGFDYAVYYTVVNFGNPELLGAVQGGIDTAWEGFRDIANIVMIALFVFIAFLVILNIQSYGIKQLVIRLVLIALLINFSLFFTQAIIDVSNATATQFVQAINLSDSDGRIAIAEGFLQKSGLGRVGFTGAQDALTGISDIQGVLMYGLIMMTFYALLIAVFLLGTILLLSRAIVFLLLMVLSALAFAAYLVPKQGGQWWGQWWSALIKNALFAPVFMLLLWASSNIANTLSDGDIARVIETSSDSLGIGSWEPLMVALIVVGLFYASLQIASSLSLFGAKFATDLSRKSLGWGVSPFGAFAALGGWAGRRTLGGRGVKWSREANEKIASGQDSIATRAKLRLGNNLSRYSFDARTTKLGKNLGIKQPEQKPSYDASIKTEADYARKPVDTRFEELMSDYDRREKEREQGLAQPQRMPSETTPDEAAREKRDTKAPSVRITEPQVDAATQQGTENDERENAARKQANEIGGKGNEIDRLAERAKREASGAQGVPSARNPLTDTDIAALERERARLEQETSSPNASALSDEERLEKSARLDEINAELEGAQKRDTDAQPAASGAGAAAPTQDVPSGDVRAPETPQAPPAPKDTTGQGKRNDIAGEDDAIAQQAAAVQKGLTQKEQEAFAGTSDRMTQEMADEALSSQEQHQKTETPEEKAQHREEYKKLARQQALNEYKEKGGFFGGPSRSMRKAVAAKLAKEKDTDATSESLEDIKKRLDRIQKGSDTSE